jgi:hypothetical protein
MDTKENTTNMLFLIGGAFLLYYFLQSCGFFGGNKSVEGFEPLENPDPIVHRYQSPFLDGVYPETEQDDDELNRLIENDKISPSDLLPIDLDAKEFNEANPKVDGSVMNVSLVDPRAFVGVDSVGGSLRNSNLQIRSEPPNPIVQNLTPFNNSTISPDLLRKPLE